MRRDSSLVISMTQAEETKKLKQEIDALRRGKERLLEMVAQLRLSLVESEERADELGAELLASRLDDRLDDSVGGACAASGGLSATDAILNGASGGSRRLRRQRTLLLLPTRTAMLMLMSRWPDLKEEISSGSSAGFSNEPVSVRETRVLGALVDGLRSHGVAPLLYFFLILFALIFALRGLLWLAL